ncbi:tetratricopeptide repeat protein [Levilinea saccharolytica]|uniref:Protein containing tetratricopeptide repeat n=1 Tax=Levilinea saccharolytica TaxID=229921 RepID=A0A0M8JPX0_9CHLR|nr:tetratricopeptide repeat protein [Levilinea saccharolytica]KPL85668.1 hypothetical protein ADN01_05980 [Levilinea saccharolytica]GAP19377.1 protein containing tetratricopeptide repeat [Levilinea saccharolytica]
MSGNQKTFERAMNLGHSAAWDQNWEQAAGFYRQALEEFPEHPMALTSLALALFEEQLFDESLKLYLQASQIIPEDPIPVEKIARICERQGRLNDAVQACLKAAELHLKGRNVEKAVENWVRAISLQPEHQMARTRLAMVYERIGRKADAVTEYLATASLMQSAGEVGKALQVVEYALQIQPDSADAKQALVMLKANQRLPKPPRPRGGTGPVRMAEVRQLSVPEDSGKPQVDPLTEARQDALVDLAGLLFEQAEEADAAELQPRRGINALSRGTGGLSLGQNERMRILMHLGQAIESQTQGDDNQAAEELERATDIGMSHPAAYFDLGLLRLERQGQRAMRYLQKAVRSPKFALASYLLMAQAYEKELDWSQAAQCYLQALRLADIQTVPEAQAEELRQLYEPIIDELGRESDTAALQKLCETVRQQLLRSDYRQYLQNARQQLVAQNGDSLPLPLAEMLLQTNSSQIVDSLSEVRRLTQQKLYRSAMEEAFRAIEVAPTYLPLHTQIGDILLREGLVEQAVQKFLLVAEVYNYRGEVPQAVGLLQRVIQMAPMDMSVRNRLIDLLVAQGRIDDAIHQYMDLASLYYHLTELDMARQTYATALRVAQQHSVDRSLSVQLLYRIADIDLQHLDMRQAVRVFEQIRTLEPEDEKARVQLVNMNFRLGQEANALSEVDGFVALLEHTGKRKQSIDFVKAVINEHPNRPELIKRLADLYARNGQTAEAIAELDGLADLLLTAGNVQGAAAMLKTIINLRPPNAADYEAALRKLQSGKL